MGYDTSVKHPGLLNDILFKIVFGSKDRLWEPTLNVPLLDLLELHYIELRKFSPAKPQELQTRFERWLYLLKFADLFNVDNPALPEALAQEEGIPMAVDSMRKAYGRDEIREMIEAREKADRDEVSRLHHARQEGVQQGLQQAALGMASSGLSRDRIEAALGVSQAQLAEWLADNA